MRSIWNAHLFDRRNGHKVRELRAILPGVDLSPLLAGIELPPEDGATLGVNALIKEKGSAPSFGNC